MQAFLIHTNKFRNIIYMWSLNPKKWPLWTKNEIATTDTFVFVTYMQMKQHWPAKYNSSDVDSALRRSGAFPSLTHTGSSVPSGWSWVPLHDLSSETRFLSKELWSQASPWFKNSLTWGSVKRSFSLKRFGDLCLDRKRGGWDRGVCSNQSWELMA